MSRSIWKKNRKKAEIDLKPRITFDAIKQSAAKKHGYQLGVENTVNIYSAVILLCLKDKFDFTSQQLKDVAWYINETFDSVTEGYLSLDDIIKTIQEEDGLDVRFLNQASGNV